MIIQHNRFCCQHQTVCKTYLPPGVFCDVVLFPVCRCGPVSIEVVLVSRIAAVVIQVAAACSTWVEVAEAAVIWHVVPVTDEQVVMMAPLIVEVMLAVEVWLAVEETLPEIKVTGCLNVFQIEWKGFLMSIVGKMQLWNVITVRGGSIHLNRWKSNMSTFWQRAFSVCSNVFSCGCCTSNWHWALLCSWTPLNGRCGHRFVR